MKKLTEETADFYARELDRTVQWLAGFKAHGDVGANFPSLQMLSVIRAHFVELSETKDDGEGATISVKAPDNVAYVSPSDGYYEPSAQKIKIIKKRHLRAVAEKTKSAPAYKRQPNARKCPRSWPRLGASGRGGK